MTPKISIFISLGICAHCKHLMIENVDYDFYATVDGHCLAIPDGCEPPAIICSRMANDGRLLDAVGVTYHSTDNEDVPPTACEFFEEDDDVEEADE